MKIQRFFKHVGVMRICRLSAVSLFRFWDNYIKESIKAKCLMESLNYLRTTDGTTIINKKKKMPDFTASSLKFSGPTRT